MEGEKGKQQADPGNVQKPRKRRRRRSKRGQDKEPEYVTAFENGLIRSITSIRNRFTNSIRVLEDEIEDLKELHEEQLKVKDQELTAAKNEIEDLKAALLKQIPKRGSAKEPDDKIQDTLSDLMDELKRWAKKYGITDSASLLDDSVKFNVIATLTAGPRPFACENSVRTAIDQGISAIVLLNSLLTKHLFGNMLSNQFYCLEHAEPSFDLSQAVQSVWRLIDQVNPDKASVLSSQTMALLQDNDRVKDLKFCQFQRFVQAFLQIPSTKTLLRDVAGAGRSMMTAELLTITARIGDYLMKIGTQKVRIYLSAFDTLESRPFQIRSKKWKPHPCMHLEEGDTSCDGKDILLVVEPGIIAYGNGDGTHYHQQKVWHPAKVIIQRPKAQEHPQSAAQITTPKPVGGSLDNALEIEDSDQDDSVIDYADTEKKKSPTEAEHKSFSPADQSSKEESGANKDILQFNHSTTTRSTSATGLPAEKAQLEAKSEKGFQDNGVSQLPAEKGTTELTVVAEGASSAKRKSIDGVPHNVSKKTKLNNDRHADAEGKAPAQKQKGIPDANTSPFSFTNLYQSIKVEKTETQMEEKNGLPQQTQTGSHSSDGKSAAQSDGYVPTTENATHATTSTNGTDSHRPERGAKSKANKAIAESKDGDEEVSLSLKIKTEEDTDYAPPKPCGGLVDIQMFLKCK